MAKIACMNVQGCNDSAKRECLGRMFAERGLDVLVLSETKLKGKGEVSFGEVSGRVSGVDSGWAREGVCIIVSEEWKKYVKEWKEVSSRLMYVRLRIAESKYVIVGAYGPGSEKEQKVREDFWNDLGLLLGSFASDEIVCVLGDLNARVGDGKIQGVIGDFGVPGMNESGVWMVDMCKQNEMVVCNTLFKKRDVHKYTWIRRVRGEITERALMDFVCVKEKYKARVTDVNVLRAPGDVHSDHHLVVCKMKLMGGGRATPKPRGEVREAIRVERLQNEGCKEEFEESLKVKWLVHKGGEIGGVEEEWSALKNALTSCAESACGLKRLSERGIRKGSEWWNAEMDRLTKKKRDMYRVWLQNRDRQTYDRYKDVRKEVKRAVRRAKRDANERWGMKLAEDFSSNKKMFWREVKRSRKGGEVVEECVKDANGNVLSASGEVCERWKEYFDGLLNVDDGRRAQITVLTGGSVGRSDVMNAEVRLQEVLEAINRLKSGKASGMDGVKAEYLKCGGVVCAEWMVRLLNVCMNSGVVPKDWKMGCIVPLYKGKADPLDYNNSEGESLL